MAEFYLADRCSDYCKECRIERQPKTIECATLIDYDFTSAGCHGAFVLHGRRWAFLQVRQLGGSEYEVSFCQRDSLASVLGSGGIQDVALTLRVYGYEAEEIKALLWAPCDELSETVFPDDPPAPLPCESEIKAVVCAHLRASGISYTTESICGSGRADILTDSAVIEIETYLTRNKIFEAVGQALLYRAAIDPTLRAVICGQLVEGTTAQLKYLESVGVELWAVDGATVTINPSFA